MLPGRPNSQGFPMHWAGARLMPLRCKCLLIILAIFLEQRGSTHEASRALQFSVLRRMVKNVRRMIRVRLFQSYPQTNALTDLIDVASDMIWSPRFFSTRSSAFHECVLSSRHRAGKLGMGWAGVRSMASPQLPLKGEASLTRESAVTRG